MIKSSLLILFCALFTTPAFASIKLDPELTTPEYQALLDQRMDFTGAASAEDIAIEQYLAFGKKNLDWLDLVNSKRPANQKISFSSEATQAGNAVANPRVYNFNTITAQWDLLKALLPAALKDVIFNNAPMTSTLPVSEREFIEWLNQVDAAYQISSRYKLLKPEMKDYIQGQMYDVRGYITFRDTPEANNELASWNTLTNVKKEKYRNALVRICENAELTLNECIDQFNVAEKSLKLLEMKNLYFPKSELNYKSYFEIPATRKDAVWNASNPNLFVLPFADPKNLDVKNYLKVNIEDEWKWNGWKLNLSFINSNDPNTTHIEFKAGSTPHVNDIAGSIITMDANTPFTEFATRWTIRHEFGHVLGFPDCYVEFYDEELDSFVSYQLDLTNLMCSRRGKFKQIHFDELKRSYFK